MRDCSYLGSSKDKIRKVLGRVYRFARRVAIARARQSPISSKLLGPPKGIITDIKQWVSEYKIKVKHQRPLEECWYSTVHGPAVISRLPPRAVVPLPSMFLKEQRVYQQEAFTACIPRARVIMRTGLVISPDDRAFAQSCIWGQQFFPFDIEFNTLRLKSRKLNGSYMTIISRDWFNYYHWICECLTRLCVADVPSDVPILLPTNLRAWHKESLALLGVQKDRWWYVDKGCYEVAQLYLPSFAGTTGTRANIADWALRDLRQRFCGNHKRNGGKLLYVSRAGASRGRVTNNEDEVIQALEREGFITVQTHRLTVAEQIKLFADAKVIVGVHGAGLTNMLFAPTGTVVIEVLDPEYLAPFYYALSTSLGHQYWYLLGENESVKKGKPVNSGYDPISVPIELLLRTITAALSKESRFLNPTSNNS